MELSIVHPLQIKHDAHMTSDIRHLYPLDRHRPLRVQLIRVSLVALLFAIFQALALVVFE